MSTVAPVTNKSATDAKRVNAESPSPAMVAATQGNNSGSSLFVSTATMLWWRDIIRFYRQPSRIVGAIASPIIFWIFLGAGLGSSFSPPGLTAEIDFLSYFFPGILVLILLFTAIFSTISLIEDRNAGFLQHALVAPGPRSALVTGKLLGAASLALMQGIIFLLLAPIAGIQVTIGSILLTLLLMAIIAFGLSGLGFFIAWRMDSTQGFHAIMTSFLLPLWMLSGAAFPAAGASGWIVWMMRANPVAYGVDSLRFAMMPREVADGLALSPLPIALIVTCAFAAGMFFICTQIAHKTPMPAAKGSKKRRKNH